MDIAEIGTLDCLAIGQILKTPRSPIYPKPLQTVLTFLLPHDSGRKSEAEDLAELGLI